jgi:hypothetical protein
MSAASVVCGNVAKIVSDADEIAVTCAGLSVAVASGVADAIGEALGAADGDVDDFDGIIDVDPPEQPTSAAPVTSAANAKIS